MLPFWALFLLFGVLGWLLDTSYRSIVDKKYAPGTWLPYFGLIYAIGGTLCVLLFENIHVSAPVQVLIGTLAAVVLEFVGGVLSLAILRRRLWNYSHERLHFMGHIDMLHTVYWFAIVILVRVAYGVLTGYP